MKVTQKEFKTDKGLYVTLEYSDLGATTITIQGTDGKVIFAGDHDEADRLLEALEEIKVEARHSDMDDIEIPGFEGTMDKFDQILIKAGFKTKKDKLDEIDTTTEYGTITPGEYSTDSIIL